MRGPLTAMYWELWRTSRFELLIRIAGQSSLMLLLGTLADDYSIAEKRVVSGLAIGLLLVSSIFSQTWLNEFDNKAEGFVFRLGFVRPVSTWTLCLVPWSFCIVTAAISYCIPAILFALVLRMPVPLLGPTTLVTTVVTVLVSLAWAIPRRSEKGVALGLLLLASVLLSHFVERGSESREPLLFRMGTMEIFRFHGWQYLGALSVISIAVLLTRISVERQRHGEQVSLFHLRIPRFIGRQVPRSRSSSASRAFMSKTAAQFWYEWRQCGATVMGIAIVSALLLSIVLLVVPWLNPRMKYDHRFWVGALLVCPVIYQLVAVERAIGLSRIQGSTRLSLFDATRCLTDSQMIAIKLLVVATSTFLGWMCMLISAIVFTLLHGSSREWSGLASQVATILGSVSWLWRIAGVSSITLAFISMSSMLLAFALWLPANHRRASLAFVLLTIHAWLFVWDAHNGWPFRAVWFGYAYVLSITIIVGSVYLLVKAFRSGSLSLGYFTGVSALWLMYVVSTVLTCWKIHSGFSFALPLPVLFLAASALVTPLTSVALAPLALGTWRRQ